MFHTKILTTLANCEDIFFLLSESCDMLNATMHSLTSRAMKRNHLTEVTPFTTPKYSCFRLFVSVCGCLCFSIVHSSFYETRQRRDEKQCKKYQLVRDQCKFKSIGIASWAIGKQWASQAIKNWLQKERERANCDALAVHLQALLLVYSVSWSYETQKEKERWSKLRKPQQRTTRRRTESIFADESCCLATESHSSALH